MSIYRVVFSVMIAYFLIACVPGRDAASDEKIEIVEMTMLPDLTSTNYTQRAKPKVLIRIMADGSVDEVVIMNPSGRSEWDAATIDSIKKWRFSRLPPNSPPEGVIYRIVLDIKPLYDPAIYAIGELWATCMEEADSLYAELKEGTDFFELASRLQEVPSVDSAYILRSTDLANYPEHVRRVVGKLRHDEFSKPVKVGDYFVIYMRFRENEVQHLL